MQLHRGYARDFSWKRTLQGDEGAAEAAERIVRDVRALGDDALLSYTTAFDFRTHKVAGYKLAVSPRELEKAWNQLDEGLQSALTAASRRIRAFHERQVPREIDFIDDDGARLGMVWRPIRRVGVYAPGGRAAYPSTVLMNVIPAQVAQVPEIVLVSPPSRESGLPHPLVLAAAHLLGVTSVFAVGGAQAVAALAYGTESIPKVDKIVGPGNLYVALAKRAVMGDVGIDSIAGPSEVFIIADDRADPRFAAADMLAQAEHDPEAGAVCVVFSEQQAEAVERTLREQLVQLPRRDIAEAALESYGAILVAESSAEAIRVVNEAAPEHLELLVDEVEDFLPHIQTAGAVFLGSYTPEPVGDYYAGTNHVLPTHGTARFASGLGVSDFLRRMSYVGYSRDTLLKHEAHITRLANAEGLSAHARSVGIRFSSPEQGIEEGANE